MSDSQGTDLLIGYQRKRKGGGGYKGWVRVVRWRVQDRESLLWFCMHTGTSYWLLGHVSALGNRCEDLKQVDITGMSGIVPLYRTLNVLSPLES